MTKTTPCPHCGFQHQCICNDIPNIHSSLPIALLMHENELSRDTNTGRLLLQTLPECSQHVWVRKEQPEALFNRIKIQGLQPYLLFPNEHSVDVTTLHDTTAAQNSAESDTSSQHQAIKPLFIILDGTWQEAKKMLRRSPWLKALPHVHLSSTASSRYQLRRNQDDGHLCTCEVAIELLSQLGETSSSIQLSQYFDHYMAMFKADKCGHLLKK
ncbi:MULTISPECIES: tRNA-uridine aminocarboxypropyltransferase [Vibrio]|uniref:tRNA-uridine aminocarboxypropyltransferase n=1 Tax=Vibrio genomosp. F6 str. FF-238 TaxID=1191298 RepID=A0A1E5CNJ6_9VIBR|nr:MULTISPECIES: DTW domain-containing protein [Vibrio]MDN3696661.1 DTW domain-containing protein [Vibrio cortegadensis]OEE70825.1 DTW domain-containing protein [Vibrio genomosp. F6 str. FF-238]TKF18764.1 DTW domain-containing protein [Vibrio genomosp. F6]